MFEEYVFKVYLFSYEFEGSKYSIQIHATSAEEAKRKILCAATAQYDGEHICDIPVVPGFRPVFRLACFSAQVVKWIFKCRVKSKL